jgi:hypothetical protein
MPVSQQDAITAILLFEKTKSKDRSLRQLLQGSLRRN